MENIDSKSATCHYNSIYVSASAGSGKTKLLTDRILNLLLQDVQPSSILCLTFTNSAALEVKQRIVTGLEGWLKLSDAELTQEVRSITGAQNIDLTNARQLHAKTLHMLHEFKIMTLHSLCLELLSSSRDISNFPDNFKLIDKFQQQYTLNSAFDTVIEEGGDLIEYSLQELSSQYEYSTIKNLVKDIIANKISLISILDRYDAISDILKNIENKFLPDNFDKTKYLQSWFKSDDAPEIHLLLQCLREVGKGEDNTLEKWIHSSDREQLFHSYYSLFFTKNHRPRKSVLAKKFLDKYPGLASFIAREQDKLQDFRQKLNGNILTELNQALIILVNIVLKQYEELKYAKGFIEYSDLIIETLRVLNSSHGASSLLYKVDVNLKHVLVDEAQDLSEVQWELIKLITAEFFSGNEPEPRTVFIVGDLKQSIYGFQGANPKLFKSIKEYYMNLCRQVGQELYCINLDTSYRSTSAVLGAVDKIFNHPSIKEALAGHGIDGVSHTPYREERGLVNIWPKMLLTQPGTTSRDWELDADRGTGNRTKYRLAEQITDEISDWIKNGRKIYSTDKIIQPQDILILLRKRGELQQYIIAELKERNIPVSEADRITLTESLLVRDLLSLARFIANPHDDLNLAGLMRSPVLDLSEEQLFEVAHNRGKTSIWDRIKSLFPHIAEKLASYIDLARRTNIYDFYKYVLDCNNIYRKFIERFGDKAYFLIDSFLTQILIYQEQNKFDYDSFVHWVQQSKLEVHNDSPGNNVGVRIMTVHNAKGLEAPIVIIADASDTDLGSLPRDKILWEKDCILLHSSSNLEDTAYMQEVKKRHRNNLEAENLRLLYVAMTRARDELHICGYEKKQTGVLNWYNLFKEIIGESSSVEYRYGDDISMMYPQVQNDHIIGSVEKTPEFTQGIPSISHSSDSGNEATRFGEITHKLLHRMSFAKNINSAHSLITAYIAHEEITASRKERLERYAYGILEHYPEIILNDNAHSEVPFISRDSGNIVIAQMDKLIIKNDSVEIIDYKTDSVVPDTPDMLPESYRRQLIRYKNLARAYFPNKKIQAKILWLENMRLDDV